MNQEPLQMQSCEPQAPKEFGEVAQKTHVREAPDFWFAFAFQFIGEILDTPRPPRINQQQFDPNSLLPTVLSYYGYDGHGSVRFLMDTNGVVTDTYTYEAFGNLIASNEVTPNNYLYCGQQWDPVLGLYYNRARYVEPDLGRFTSMDTFAGNNEDPLSLHKYLYAADNPINLDDPSGSDYGDFDINFSPGLAIAMSIATAANANGENLPFAYLRGISTRYEATVFRTLIIHPVLEAVQNDAKLSPKITGDAAEELLLGTAIEESQGLKYRRQKGGGPALGLFQIEPDTYNSLWDNYIDDRHALKKAIFDEFHVSSRPDPGMVARNDSYATIMARIRYRTVKAHIPAAGDRTGQATYWKTYYNTHGKGTVEEYVDDWNYFMSH